MIAGGDDNPLTFVPQRTGSGCACQETFDTDPAGRCFVGRGPSWTPITSRSEAVEGGPG